MDEPPAPPSDGADWTASSPRGKSTDMSILDAVADGMYQLDRDGRFAAVNDALASLTGYDRDELLGRHVSTVLDAEDVLRVEDAIRNQLLDGDRDSVRFDLPVYTATGGTVACEVRITPVVREETFRGTVGVVREIDDPDAAADVRDAGERRQAFDALAEASADGIIMLDDASVIRYANPAVERILGHAPEELVGSSKMKIIPDHLRQVHADALQRYLDTGEKHIDWTYVELPGLHADGHEVPLAISLNEFEHDGEHYFVGTFRDISKRKEIERELERQNDRLDRFASMLAHELRNPLQTAKLYLGFVPEDGEDAVEEVREALGRIEEIIDVLLVLARSGDGIDGREAVELIDVAATAWANTDTGSAEIALETNRALWVNPMHLQHLLENLFRNSVEHGSTSRQPGADDADREGIHCDDDVTVRVGALDDGFYVEDDGSGIPDDEREDVVRAGYTTGSEGIGLGLTFVAQLADAYGWEYAITESDDGGARFEFTDVETVPDDAETIPDDAETVPDE